MPQPKDKDWLNGYKNKTPIYVVYKRPTSKQGTHRLKVKGWKKIFYANEDQRKVRVAILISDKIDFKIKAVKRDKEGHYTMIKGSIQEEDKKKDHEKILEIILENFPKMGKEISTQIQETQRVPNRINPRQNTPRHILIK